jgi:5'-3' exoribonuclease 1
MVDPNSPILDFYPHNFELDLNGKKQDWEAIVVIPFIDQHRLLEAVKCKRC